MSRSYARRVNAVLKDAQEMGLEVQVISRDGDSGTWRILGDDGQALFTMRIPCSSDSIGAWERAIKRVKEKREEQARNLAHHADRAFARPMDVPDEAIPIMGPSLDAGAAPGAWLAVFELVEDSATGALYKPRPATPEDLAEAGYLHPDEVEEKLRQKMLGHVEDVERNVKALAQERDAAVRDRDKADQRARDAEDRVRRLREVLGE